MKKFSTVIFSLIALISGCSFLIENFDNENYEVIHVDNKNLSIVFSHNINGETHPCGCRHFPLGGLPQIAGLMHEVGQKGRMFYVDTGDSLFPSSVLPDFTAESLKFGARNLAKALDQLGLKYMVPGDQDLAAGIGFLKKITDEVSFRFLIANLSDEKILPHKKWIKLKEGPHEIYMVGLVNPETLRGEQKSLFTSPLEALKKTLVEMEKNGFKPKDPFHRLIVLSHAGIESDEKLAAEVDNIDWIIGAHSMSFTKFPLATNGAKVIQVLSRNHYLGELKISLSSDQSNDKFEILEARDETMKKLNPNPFVEFIDRHKAEVDKIRKEEQKKFSVAANTDVKMQSATSCLECHTEQTRFWQKTPHSLAYITLINANEESNLACIKCHSVGLGNKNAFQSSADIVQFQESVSEISYEKRQQMDEKAIKSAEEEMLNAHRKKYWGEIKKSFGKVKSVRELSEARLLNYTSSWIDLDEKFKVQHNYANVQCLNCHDKHPEHPFDSDKQPLDKTARINAIKNQCLNCHNKDQSPEWYKTQDNGLPGPLDELKFIKFLKKMSCPQRQE